eukprot:gene47128-63117_t
MLTRIRNAQMRGKSSVTTPGSRQRARVLDVLAAEGYIRGYSSTDYGNGRTEFEIELKYYDGTPVIRDIKRVSKPGRRVYSGSKELPTIRNGLGITIVSTPRGVLSDAEARTHNVGGEMSRIGKRPITVPKGVTVTIDGQRATVPALPASAKTGDVVNLTMRPEAVSLANGHARDIVLDGTVAAVNFLGSVIRLKVNLGQGTAIELDTFNDQRLPPPRHDEKVQTRRSSSRHRSLPMLNILFITAD